MVRTDEAWLTSGGPDVGWTQQSDATGGSAPGDTLNKRRRDKSVADGNRGFIASLHGRNGAMDAHHDSADANGSQVGRASGQRGRVRSTVVATAGCCWATGPAKAAAWNSGRKTERP